MLAETIRQHAITDAQSGNWQAVAATLNSLTQQVIDETSWSFGLMMTAGRLPADLVTGIAGAVKAAASVNPLMDSAFIAFSTTGLQLHTAERQQMIEQIGAGLPAEAVAAVKALGVRTVPLVSTNAEQCQAAWESAQAEAAAQQAAAIRATRLASVRTLNAESIVDSATDLDACIALIRAQLVAFGGW
jgi:hypothetical protein